MGDGAILLRCRNERSKHSCVCRSFSSRHRSRLVENADNTEQSSCNRLGFFQSMLSESFRNSGCSKDCEISVIRLEADEYGSSLHRWVPTSRSNAPKNG